MRLKRSDCCQDIRYRKKSLFLLGIIMMSLCLISAPSLATPDDGSYHLILNGRSFHLSEANNGQSFNENNLGSGFQYDYHSGDRKDWISYFNGSVFNDSLNNASYYLGAGKARRFPLLNGWRIDVGYLAFVMARKDFNDYDPFPGILPIASIGTRRAAVNISYIPQLGDAPTELIFLQLKISTKGW